MINGIQIILARALLGISQEELAKLTKISLSTIGRIEKERYEVYAKGKLSNLISLENFFIKKGIKFVDQNGEVGLVINKKQGKKLEKERFKK